MTQKSISRKDKLIIYAPFATIFIAFYLVSLFGITNLYVSITMIILALISLTALIYRFKVIEPEKGKGKLRDILIIFPLTIAVYIIMNYIIY